MSNQSILAIMIGSAVVLGGLGLRARRRRAVAKNPSGIADADLSAEDRRKAAEDYTPLAEEQTDD